MFKRVSRRQRKREKEDELGLDEEMKQVLGLQDTDSDESNDSSSDAESGNDSDLDSDLDSNDEEEVNMGGRTHKRKRSVDGSGSESDESLDEEDLTDMDALDPEGFEDDSEEEGAPPMGVMAATTNPIYDVPGAPATQDLRACVLCPGKLLKNAKMVKVHVESTAHLRRLQRYVSQVSKLTSSSKGLIIDDPRVILRDMAPPQNLVATQSPGTASKRAQRREAWKEKKAERKKKRKQSKAKKAARATQDPAVSVDGGHESDRGGKETEGQTSAKKKPRVLEDVPVSMIVDLPDPAARKQRRDPEKGKKKVPQEDPSGSTRDDRPAKRRKHASTPTVSSQAVPGVDSTLAVQPQTKARDKTSQNKPALKRHDTSLYFADDEKHPGLANKSPERESGTSGHKEKKRTASSAVNRPSDSRHGQKAGHAPSRGSDQKGSPKKGKNDARTTQKNWGHATISSGKGKGQRPLGKALSAEQWGNNDILKVFD